MPTQKVKVRIEADGRQASREIKRTQGAFAKFGSAISGKLVLGLAAATAGIFALVKGMKAAVTAANVQEDAIRKLNAALVKMGPEADRVSLALQEQAAALQQVTKFGDETIIAGQALIASFTDNEQKIKDATVAALNLSAATGTELKAAFLLMGRAAAGETSTLSRYGITLEEGLSSSEKFAAAIEKINAQFGGQAQAAAETFTGKVAQLSNAYGDLLEKVGQAITENDKITATLTKLKDLLTSGGLVDGVTKFAEGLAGVVTKSVEATTNVAKFVKGLGILNDRLREAIPLLADHNEEIRLTPGLAEFATAGLFDIVKAVTALGDAQEEGVKQIKLSVSEQRAFNESQKTTVAQYILLADGTLDLNSAYEKQIEKLSLLGTAELRLQRIRKAEAKQLNSIVEIAKELGVTLEKDLISATEKSALAIEKARLAAVQGVITWEDYERIVKASADSLEELKAELTGVAAEADSASTSIDSLGNSGNSASLAIDSLNSALVVSQGNLSSLSTSIILTSNDFDRLADSAGRAAAVTAAVAGGGTLIQGGSRIRFGGSSSQRGSRLTSSPLLSDISTTLSGGTFTTITQPVQATPDGGLVFN